MKNVILASGSAQRKIIMEALGIPFEIIPADLDERAIQDADPKKRAEKLARAKAEKVAGEHEGVLIAADTFVVLNGITLEKPDDIEEAKEMLRRQSQQTFEVITGFCYLDHKAGIDFSTTEAMQTTMRELTNQEIEDYVQKFPVTTWSAAFAPTYPYVSSFIRRINGSYTSFVYGLPMEHVVPLLRTSGISLDPKPL